MRAMAQRADTRRIISSPSLRRFAAAAAAEAAAAEPSVAEPSAAAGARQQLRERDVCDGAAS
jgi:hypothetical protein